MESLSSVNRLFIPNQSSFLVPSRVDIQELLDLGIGSQQDVEANFADLKRINRYLGGVNAITRHLYPRLLNQENTSTIVDIGTGSGDMLTSIDQWAIKNQLDLKLWGLDLSARNLETCSDIPSIASRLIQADGLQLPFKSDSVDYFISSLTLHHLSPDQIIQLLTSTFKAAKRGIIMSDLVRGRLPEIAFSLGQPIFAHSFLTRHDGIASIRRAYLPDELAQLAHMAGIPNARVYKHPLWRMTLVADK